MEERLRRIYIPMTETCFYILLCLRDEMHGYNIGLTVKELTGGEIVISPGTMYGTLAKLEKDGLIKLVKQEEKRKSYIITDLGTTILETELRRIERLYKNSKGEMWNE
ncbi:MAG: PadR family transcriptional regulator [Lachnospira sp.]|nr:PadR family transcriptional regulator [Lachnospira sp.]